jgi:hypothetical protein
MEEINHGRGEREEEEWKSDGEGRKGRTIEVREGVPIEVRPECEQNGVGG